MNSNVLLLVILLVFTVILIPAIRPLESNVVPVCESTIYCQGPILDAVNTLRVYDDSKQFVDMPLIFSPEKTIADFQSAFSEKKNMTLETLKLFLKSHFHPTGHELISCDPVDWTPSPKAFQQITDVTYNKWAHDLNAIWKQLCKQINKSVEISADKHSILYVEHPFLVVGGRFQEFYYWDSYWTLKGALLSGMYTTTKLMIKNYIELVKKYGFVPNGGRVYYLKRSQPPMLIPMVYDYYQATGDKDFLLEVLPTLEKELLFWYKNRNTYVTTKNGKSYVAFLYNSSSNVPRPESYYRDVQDAKSLPESERANFYSNIASAAESGWDFSSRWFADRWTIQTIKIKRILPVDLNAFICGNVKMLSEMFAYAGQTNKSSNYAKTYDMFVATMMELFYNSTLGAWFDYDLDFSRHNTNFYMASFVPLFTGCYKFTDSKDVEKTLEYLKKTGAFNYPGGGIPTTLINSSQQWDFPNGWPPLNHMIIEGFRKSNSTLLQNTAFQLADQWLQKNYLLYNKTSNMFEKYDATIPNNAGRGGEYDVQVGFGWTNGVALDLLRTYGDRLILKTT